MGLPVRHCRAVRDFVTSTFLLFQPDFLLHFFQSCHRQLSEVLSGGLTSISSSGLVKLSPVLLQFACQSYLSGF